MWLFLLILAIGAGWQVVRLLPLKWRPLEAGAASVALGFTVAPWVYFVSAFALGWPAALWVGTIVLIAAQAAAQFLLKRSATFESWRLPPPARQRAFKVLIWIPAAATVLLLTTLMLHSYTLPTTGDWYSAGNVWGDSPLHIDLATHFAHGAKLDTVSPVYEQIPLTYPFMSDFWSGVLLRTTGSWTGALVVPSVLMLWALLGLIYAAGRRVLRSELAAWLAWFMLVFSGSLQGLLKLLGALLTGTYQTFFSQAQFSIANATNDTYLNFFDSHIFPQRTYMFGMPLLIVIGLVALELYRERHSDHRRRELQIGGIAAGVLLGLLPLVHTHSFMVIAGLLALATAALWIRERRLPAGWLAMLLVAAVLAAPQLYYQFSRGFHTGFSHWIWGWVVEGFYPSKRNWLDFWLANTGWLMVTLLAGWYWLRRAGAQAEVWLIYVGGVLIFLLCNVYVFQPSIWDNMKFFEYAFWLMMLVTAYVLARWCRVWWGRIATGVIVASICGLGFYELTVIALPQHYVLLTAQERAFGEHLQKILPANAYLLTGDRHNSPVTMLADRRVVMTYSGWYNLYGANWPTTIHDRGIMLQGGPGAAGLISQYHPNFAAFSDAEVATGEASLSYFQDNYAVFDHEAGWWVFDLRKHP